MIEKREEILNSILSFSSPPEANHSACTVGFSQAGYRKPAGSVGDSWVLEIIAGKGAVKEKRSVQASKLSTTEIIEYTLLHEALNLIPDTIC